MGEVLRMDRTPHGEKPTPRQKVAPGEVRAALLEQLAEHPATLTELGRSVGRAPSDRTLRARLSSLEAESAIEREDGLYRLVPAPTDPPVEVPEKFAGYEFPQHFDRASQQQLVVKLDELPTIEWTSAAIELLESYIDCLQRARNAQASIDAHGEFNVAAKTGRVWVHPGVAVVTKAQRDAQVYRAALQKLDDAGGRGGARDVADDQKQLF